MPQPDLIVILPVYNESASVGRVLREWHSVLANTLENFVILAIDDGSKDNTLEILQQERETLGGRMEILTRANRGHGQSCLEGYRIACQRKIPFILQIDSDGQSDPRFFPEFWKLRDSCEVIYGKRERHDGWARVIASGTLRNLLRILERVDCVDANVPYRLMNTEKCASTFAQIPREISLANIALAVLLKRQPAIRHGAVPITFPARYGGEPSVPLRQFAMKGLELFQQLHAMKTNPDCLLK